MSGAKKQTRRDAIRAALTADPRVEVWYSHVPDPRYGRRWIVCGRELPETNGSYTTREVEMLVAFLKHSGGSQENDQ